MFIQRLSLLCFVFTSAFAFSLRSELQLPLEWAPSNGVSIGHRQGPLRYVNPPVKLKNGDSVTVSTVNENWSNSTVVLLKYGADLAVKAHHTIEFEDIRSGLDYPRIFKLDDGTLLIAGVFKEHLFADPMLWLGSFDENFQRLSLSLLQIYTEGVDYFFPRWVKLHKLEEGYRFFIQGSQEGPFEGLSVLDTDGNFEITQRGWLSKPGARFFPLKGQAGAYSVVALPGFYDGGHRIASFRRYCFDASSNLVEEVESNENLGEADEVVELASGNLRLTGGEVYSSPSDSRLRTRISEIELSPRGELVRKTTNSEFDKDWRYVSLKKKIELADGNTVWVASGRYSSNEDPRVLLLLQNGQGETINTCVWGAGTGIYLSSVLLNDAGKLHLVGNRDRSEVWIAEVDPYACSRDNPKKIVLD